MLDSIARSFAAAAAAARCCFIFFAALAGASTYLLSTWLFNASCPLRPSDRRRPHCFGCETRPMRQWLPYCSCFKLARARLALLCVRVLLVVVGGGIFGGTSSEEAARCHGFFTSSNVNRKQGAMKWLLFRQRKRCILRRLLELIVVPAAL